MFSWYQNSRVCYVYLHDVIEFTCDKDTNKLDIVSQLQHAEWFARGWTLQELIAPTTLVFFSRDWVQLGVIQFAVRSYDSHDVDPKDVLYEFEQAICSIANIPNTALGPRDLSHFSVAEKMSWAANRKTTRVEDVAYSMMGLFDVNMPLLYGEGSKAFQRLQRQIIETTEDYTIFAWEPMWDLWEPEPTSASFLAAGPRNFLPKRNAGWTQQDLGRFQYYSGDWDQSELEFVGHIPPSVTSRGIYMPLPIVDTGKEVLALLANISNMSVTTWLGMEIRAWKSGHGQYRDMINFGAVICSVARSANLL